MPDALAEQAVSANQQRPYGARATFDHMWVLLLVVAIAVCVVAYVLVRPGTSTTITDRPPSARRVTPKVTENDLMSEFDQAIGEIRPQLARAMADMEAELNRLHPDPPREVDDEAKPLGLYDHDRDNLPQRQEGPSWMEPKDWERRVIRYREQGRSEREIAETSGYLEQRGPHRPRTRAEGMGRSEQIGTVTRAVYAPKEDEARYMTRDEDGLPTLRFVDSGDRLSIWSPLEDGALINPKGPGLRSLGLCSSYARGADHYPTAFRNADLRKGKWVDLKREPENPHDKNAVALCTPGSTVPFGYLQRGRAPAVAKRMDKGEDMAAVSLRGPAKGRDDEKALLIVGSRTDLAVMLDG